MYDVMEGVRAVEVASFLMVPVAGAILADWGADVIKVEHPKTGDPYRGLRNDAVRPGFPNQMLEIPNRGKRSVGIDVATTEGREVLFHLLREADVFLTNFMPATLQKLGLEWEDIHAVDPRIVYARGSGYGPVGPDAEAPAFDLAATWARAGLLDRITRDDSDEPAVFPGSVGDLSAGINLAAGIAGALFRRERTGEGTQVDVSLLHTGTWILGQSISAAAVGLDGAAIGAIAATRKHPPNPLVNSYLSSDRRWLTFACLQADKHWPDFCHYVGRPNLVDDERFVDTDARAKNSQELVALLDEVFATRTFEDWRAQFATFPGVWAPALNSVELADDPQMAANGYLAEVHAGDGSTFRSIASPVQFGGAPLGALRAMPEHAQHTEEVLLESGLTWDDLKVLKDVSAIS